MRFRELVESDYMTDLRTEIITLLTTISAEGIDEVDTQNLLVDLEEQGYAIDEESLLEILDSIEIVSSASAETIQISTSDVDMMVGQDAEFVDPARVDSLATKQATTDLGNDL